MRLWIRPWPRYTAQRLFRVDRRFRTAVRPSERVKAVAEAFGLGIDEERVFTVFEDFQLDIEPGKILLITGESGGGKSLLLRAIAAEM
ncbi:MAG: ATP-binding cassette domain-containing protein, partial [Nitrososphaerota archaeon]